MLTYTGTKGTDLDMLLALNRPPPGSATTIGPIANAGNFIYDTSGADSMYNALQARYVHRTSHGFMFNAVYTYGRSMDDASSIGGGTGVVVQNPADLRAEWGRSSFDIRNRLQTTYSYALPFGDRHRFAQEGWTGAMFGNWRLSANLNLQNGAPFTALAPAGANSSGGSSFQTRADQICNPNLPSSERTPLHYFNTACFVVPPDGQYGDAARNTIDGPGSITLNTQFQKEFTFGVDRNRRLDVNWQVNNPLNTVNLTGLSTTVGSSTFGRVSGAAGMRSMSLLMRVNF